MRFVVTNFGAKSVWDESKLSTRLKSTINIDNDFVSFRKFVMGVVGRYIAGTVHRFTRYKLRK